GKLQLVQSTAPVPLSATVSDVITVGDGNDIVIGGPGGNTITGGNGDDIVFGNDGLVTFTGFNRFSVTGQPWDVVDDTTWAGAQSNYLTLGGNDVISLGSGNDVVFGGVGNDTITLAPNQNPDITPNYAVFGGDGTVIYSPGG